MAFRGTSTLMTWLCPNIECPNKDKYKEGESCEECGSPAENFGFTQVASHFTEKDRSKRLQKAVETGEEKILFSPELTNEDLQKRIYQDMLNLDMHEAGTGWAKMGSILSGNSSQLLLAQLLKALVDENKIIIRQNELILRSLRKAH